jgi:hypothetical protein
VKLTRKQLRKLILEYSAPEKNYFGKGITALIEHPDKLYKEDEFGNQVLDREWIEKNVGHFIASGGFRDTYNVDGSSKPPLVLKISNRVDDPSKKAGIEYSSEAEITNQLELETFNKFNDYGFFPNVYPGERNMDGTPRLSLPRWLLVEKVNVIETLEEMEDQIKKVFPGVEDAYNTLNLWFELTPYYHPNNVSKAVLEADKEIMNLSNVGLWIQILFQTAIKGGNIHSGTLFETLMSLKVWDEMGLSFDQKNKIINDEILSEIQKDFINDFNIIKFNRVIKDALTQTGYFFDYNEIAPGNVATDLKGNGFKLIDISVFDRAGEYGI